MTFLTLTLILNQLLSSSKPVRLILPCYNCTESGRVGCLFATTSSHIFYSVRPHQEYSSEKNLLPERRPPLSTGIQVPPSNQSRRLPTLYSIMYLFIVVLVLLSNLLSPFTHLPSTASKTPNPSPPASTFPAKSPCSSAASASYTSSSSSGNMRW